MLPIIDWLFFRTKIQVAFLSIRLHLIKFLFLATFYLMGESARFRRGYRTIRSSYPNIPAPKRMPYSIDELPIVEKRQPLDYKVLLQQYHQQNGKPLPKVKRQKQSTQIPKNIRCVWCNAPHDYLYQNNGGRGQFLCKVCKNTFFRNTKKRTITYRCPHCMKTLQPIKFRKAFTVFKCVNRKCPFRLKRLKNLSYHEKKLRKQYPNLVKVNYIFREPTAKLFKTNPNLPIQPTVDLAKIHSPIAIVPIILYYYIQLGQSARQIQQVLKDLYQFSISHQTILNYIESAAFRLFPLTQDTTIHIQHDFVSDETYIRISGRWGYVIFTYVPKQQLISTQTVCLHRDTQNATQTLWQNLQKIDPSLIQDGVCKLLFVSDGSPIYKLAQHFAQQNGLTIQHKTVIGLQNLDPESAEFRIFKQFIERLNRTFKEKYRTSCGFKSIDGAIVFVTLFVVWFNFLKPNRTVGLKPNLTAKLKKTPYAPARWLILIQEAQRR